MSNEIKPMIGNWYVNGIGKLIKVKMMLMEFGSMSKILIEYLDGTKDIILTTEWNELEIKKSISASTSSMYRN